MVGIVTTFEAKPGQFDELVRVVENGRAVWGAAKGFKSYTLLADRSQNKLMAVHLFETQADLEAWLASPVRNQTAMPALMPLVAGELVRQVYEVMVQG